MTESIEKARQFLTKKGWYSTNPVIGGALFEAIAVLLAEYETEIMPSPEIPDISDIETIETIPETIETENTAFEIFKPTEEQWEKLCLWVGKGGVSKEKVTDFLIDRVLFITLEQEAELERLRQ